MVLKCLTFLCLSGLSFSLLAQTHNDNMVSAEQLTINQFVTSKTHGNTVEAQCVDEKLTGKCIDYHNDQWYTFNSGSLNKVYINISGQNCRDLLGVQLVVLSGELCDPSTYTIYDCISLATQDDIYVEVNKLEPNHQYWLNVDGYLHDFCAFFIEVSDKPKGYSVEPLELIETSANSHLNIIKMNWEIPDSLASKVMYTNVLLRKEKEFRFDSVASVPVQFNSFGAMRSLYQHQDTLLLPGNYYYRLGLVLNTGKKLFIKEFSFRVPPSYGVPPNSTVTVPINFRPNTLAQVLIINPSTGKILEDLTFKVEPRMHGKFSFYTNKFINRGVKAIEVRVINKYENHAQSRFFKF